MADQPTLWENWVELSEEFFKAVTAHPVPVDMNALQHLKGSALALDLYAWLTHEAFRSSTRKKSRRVAWRSLHEQFGADYSDLRNFSRKAMEALGKIKTVYPGLEIETFRGSLTIKPGQLAIPTKTVSVSAKPQEPPLPSAKATKKPSVEPPSPTPRISPRTIATATNLVQGTDWDITEIERQFYEYIQKKGAPKYLSRAFLGFVRKKIKSQP